MSRIRKIEETGKVFEVPGGFDAKAHMRRAFGIVAGDKLFRVKLRFAPTVSAYIRERIWHPAQVVKERRDGGIDLEFETGGWKELVRWILSWQPDVKVLAPRRLRERVKEKMKVQPSFVRRLTDSGGQAEQDSISKAQGGEERLSVHKIAEGGDGVEGDAVGVSARALFRLAGAADNV